MGEHLLWPAISKSLQGGYGRNLDWSSGMLIAVLLRNSQYLMQTEEATSLHRRG